MFPIALPHPRQNCSDSERNNFVKVIITLELSAKISEAVNEINLRDLSQSDISVGHHFDNIHSSHRRIS